MKRCQYSCRNARQFPRNTQLNIREFIRCQSVRKNSPLSRWRKTFLKFALNICWLDKTINENYAIWYIRNEETSYLAHHTEQ
jgi:hypothetical protein